jgi:hypothetical protein
MKIQELAEMAMLGATHPEFTDDQVHQAVQWLSTGSIERPVEGGKFLLLQKGNSYALKRARDDQILGWVLLDSPTTIAGVRGYPLVNIQILPQYRNSIAVMVLINSVREVVDLPVIVDNTVFTGGQQLLNAIAKRPTALPSIFTLNKRTQEKRPYDPADMVIDRDTAFVLEQSQYGLVQDIKYPGGSTPVVMEYFAGLTDNMLDFD